MKDKWEDENEKKVGRKKNEIQMFPNILTSRSHEEGHKSWRHNRDIKWQAIRKNSTWIIKENNIIEWK